jgi:L-asparaginase II
MTAYPELVSGTGRSCAVLMRAAKGRAAVKAGAEGYYAGIVPECGLGIALKIDDGTGRASETAIAFVLEALGLLGDDAAATTQAHGPVLNTRAEKVGERRPSPALAEFGARLKTLAQ